MLPVENEWIQILQDMQIASAALVSKCAIDSTRRVYKYRNHVYKISISKNKSFDEKYREQNLAGESRILQLCESIPGIPKVKEYQITDGFELLILELIPGLPLDQISISAKKKLLFWQN